MDSEGLGVARQMILQGDKPMGTADAVREVGGRPEWKGRSVAIFNGDNFLPKGPCQLKTTEAGMLAFAQSHLGLPIERTKAFAIVEGSSEEAVCRRFRAKSMTQGRTRGFG